jgi:hypothetical protein
MATKKNNQAKKPAATGNAKPADPARDRETGAGEFMATDQGVKINDDPNSKKDGGHGGTLFEDFILREKISHFDREPIPERVDDNIFDISFMYGAEQYTGWVNPSEKLSAEGKPVSFHVILNDTSFGYLSYQHCKWMVNEDRPAELVEKIGMQIEKHYQRTWSL